MITDDATGRTLFYAPGLGRDRAASCDATFERADCVLVDGTFWTDDELIALGISDKRARDMGHLPQSGAGGMIEVLSRIPHATRKMLIHINNTNPILDEDSPSDARVCRRRHRGRVRRHGDRRLVTGYAWTPTDNRPGTSEEFEQQLRAKGDALSHPPPVPSA